MNTIFALLNLIFSFSGVYIGVVALTGNKEAAFAFGVAYSWFVYQVTLALYQILPKKE